MREAVILAGGKGTRLLPITSAIPKPMVPLFGQPVMEHCVRLLAKHGFKDIVVTISHMAHEIMSYCGDGARWGVNIRYSFEEHARGTAGGVKLVEDLIHGPFLVISGDAVTDFDLSAAADFHAAKSALATIVVHRVDDPTHYGLVETAPDGRVVRFLEKPRHKDVFTNLVNTGIYILDPEIFENIPPDSAYDFSRDLFPMLLQDRQPLYACELDGYWCDVGSLSQYRNAHIDVLLGRARVPIPGTEVEKGIWLGQDVDIHRGVALSAPLFIGDGACVRRHSELRGYCVVGDRTLIDEGASVTKSILGSETFVGRATQITNCVIGDGNRIAEHASIENRVIVDGAEKQIYPIWDLPEVPEPERVWMPESERLAA